MALAAGLTTAAAATPAASAPGAKAAGLLSQPATLRLGAETLRLPADEAVGLLGASLLIGVSDGWWVGPAVYGAATGRRGGLFVIGGEAAWRTPGPAGSRLEAGLFVGGGGGAAAPVGSGLMLRPQLGWHWPVGPGWLGVTASRVSFPDGRIGSSQVGLAYSIDTTLRHAAPGWVPAGSTARSGLGFDRVWSSAGSYHAGGVRTRYGVLRAEHWLAPGVLAGLETAAAAQGGADGYAELLASLGAEWPLGSTAARGPRIGLRAAAGLAGGGAVSTGGGALVKLAATAHWNPAGDLLVGLEAGRTVAPDGRFRANHWQLMLGLVLDRPPEAGAADGPPAPRSDTLAWDALIGHAPRMRFRDGRREAVQTLGLRLARPLDPALDPRLQLTGSVQFAAGGNAGAYGIGLIGLSWASPLAAGPGGAAATPGWRLGAELLAGAAGGGGIDARGGAVVQPMLRAGWSNGAQQWQLGLGQLHALRGELRSPVVELSWGMVLGLPRR